MVAAEIIFRARFEGSASLGKQKSLCFGLFCCISELFLVFLRVLETFLAFFLVLQN